MNRNEFAEGKSRGEYVFEGFDYKYAFDIPIGNVLLNPKDMFVIDCINDDRVTNIWNFLEQLKKSINQNYLAVRVCSMMNAKEPYGLTIDPDENNKYDDDFRPMGRRIHSIYLEGIWVDKETMEKFGSQIEVLPLDAYFYMSKQNKIQYGNTAGE